MSRLPLRARARRAARVGLPVLTLAPAALLALPAGPASAAPVTRTFTAPGCGGAVSGETSTPANVFTVPGGVTAVSVSLQGARGQGTRGGRPAKLTASSFSVTPGRTLYICVDAGFGSSDVWYGGGYSAINRGADGGETAFIAGGGGATGGSANGTVGGAGGDAGLNQANAGNGADFGGSAGGGRGGVGFGPTPAPGAGGANTLVPSYRGENGFGRRGGSGGPTGGSGYGGGGGGGLFPGGGGAGGDDADGGSPGAGGGGGTSYCEITCTDTLMNDPAGSPFVSITYNALTATTTSVSAVSTPQGRYADYTAIVDPVPAGGTVAFTVDDAPVTGCSAQPVNGDGVATCSAWVTVAGDHDLEATYSGDSGSAGSTGSGTHRVLTSTFTATPDPVAFGTVAVGTWDARDVTVTNTGEADLAIEEISGVRLGDYHPSTNPNSTDFSVLSDSCSGVTLASGEACQVTVRFSPLARGQQLAELRFDADSYDGPDPIVVSGTGVVSSLSIAPAPVGFGDVTVGTSASREVTVTNDGETEIEIFALYGIALGDYLPEDVAPNTTDHRVSVDGCSGRRLAPGASCTVTVTFTPLATGVQEAQLRVFSDAAGDIIPSVRVSGTGVAPVVRPEPRTEPRTDPEPRTEPQPRTPPAPAGRGAVLAPSALRGLTTYQNGGFRLPLQCPAAVPCRASGELTLTLAGSTNARAAAAKTTVLVRFKGVKIAAGKARTLSLRLPAAFVKAQQKKGVRKLVTTLTIRTTLGSGRTITTRQKVILLIPRAAAKPKPVQRPSFTG